MTPITVLFAFQNMKDKRENVESFAQFAKNYQQYKKNTLQYQQRVEYIKSLYEVGAITVLPSTCLFMC